MQRANCRRETDTGSTSRGWWLLLAAAALIAPAGVSAQGVNQVITVPFSQSNSALPHPAHVGGHITLKGIVRNADCATFNVAWDVNRNGNFDDDFSFQVSRNETTRNVHDIGRTFVVPDVPQDSTYNINVQVTPTCAGQDPTFGTFRLLIYDYELSEDPVQWTENELQLAGQMALQEVMWFLHRTLNTHTGRDVSTISSYYSGCAIFDRNTSPTDCRITTATSTWLLAVNGHMPALPPGTINDYGRPLPAGWEDANARRWHSDPYAETVMRMVNSMIEWSSGTTGINPDDESNACGYNPEGAEGVCNRIAGTTDTRGAYFFGANSSANVYRMGIGLGSISIVLPSLAGTPVQVGNNGVVGTNWEIGRAHV